MPKEVEETSEIEGMDTMVADVVEGLGLTEPQAEGPAEVETTTEESSAAAEQAAAKPAQEASTQAKPAAGSEAAPAAAEPSAGPPQAWRKEAQAEWAKVPDSLKSEILKREKDVAEGFGKLNQVAQIGQVFSEVVKPYFQTFRQYNIDPARHAAGLFQTHYTLAFGTPEQKTATVKNIMQQFGITSEMLSGASAQGEAPYTDPAVAALTTRFEALQSSQQQMLDGQIRNEKTRIESQVAEFAKSHPFMDEIADNIAHLINTKACSTLEQAYEQALWANPATRQKLLDQQEAERKEKETKERSERAKNARTSTAANVRSSPKSRGPTAPKGSIEDTLNSVADKLFAET